MSQQDLASFDTVIADHIATVTLKGAGKGNAMGPSFWRECPRLSHVMSRWSSSAS